MPIKLGTDNNCFFCFAHTLAPLVKITQKKLILLLSNVYVRICDESINGGELTLNFHWGLLLCK